MYKDNSQTLKGKRTRELILESAAKVIAKHGVHRASLVRIAKQAKTVPSHISHYFPKKSELVLHVIRFIFSKLASDVVRAKIDLSPEDRLIAAFRENYKYFQKHPHHYSVLVLGYSYASVYNELRVYLGEIYRHNVSSILQVLTSLNEHQKTPKAESDLRLLAESMTYDLEGGLIYHFFSAHDLGTDEYIEHHLAAQKLKLRLFFRS